MILKIWLNTTFWWSVKVCHGGEEKCEDRSVRWRYTALIGATAEHDVVHDLGEVPPHGRRPDPVFLWKVHPEIVQLTKYFPLFPFYMESFFFPLKKKWKSGWLRSRSQIDLGLRGLRNWHQMKSLWESTSDPVRPNCDLQVKLKIN